jgi:hypothetical protein
MVAWCTDCATKHMETDCSERKYNLEATSIRNTWKLKGKLPHNLLGQAHQNLTCLPYFESIPRSRHNGTCEMSSTASHTRYTQSSNKTHNKLHESYSMYLDSLAKETLTKIRPRSEVAKKQEHQLKTRVGSGKSIKSRSI